MGPCLNLLTETVREKEDRYSRLCLAIRNTFKTRKLPDRIPRVEQACYAISMVTQLFFQNHGWEECEALQMLTKDKETGELSASHCFVRTKEGAVIDMQGACVKKFIPLDARIVPPRLHKDMGIKGLQHFYVKHGYFKHFAPLFQAQWALRSRNKLFAKAVRAGEYDDQIVVNFLAQTATPVALSVAEKNFGVIIGHPHKVHAQPDDELASAQCLVLYQYVEEEYAKLTKL